MRSWLLFLFAPMLLFSGSERLRIAIQAFPVSLNPVYATDETSQAILNKIHRALFSFDFQGRPQNELAETVRIDEKTLRIFISLKKGVFFSTGRELGSDDVVATVALLKEPRFQYPYQTDLSHIDRVEKIDRYGVTLHLRAPFAPWRNYLTFKILNADEISRITPESFRRLNPSGCGPYRIVRFHEPTSVWLQRNSNNLHRRHRFFEIEYQVQRDPRQTPLKLLTSEIDAAELQNEDLPAYAASPEWQRCFRIIRYQKFGYTYLVFNLRNRILSLPLRQLIRRRILEGNFLDVFLAGNGRKVWSPFLFLSGKFAAGRTSIVSTSWPCRLKILTNSESRLRRNLLLFLIEELKPLGIELEPVFVEYHTFLKYLREKNFDLAVSALLLDLDWNLKDVLSSNGYFNYAGYSNREMDSLLDEGLREMDDQKREELYRRAHHLWSEDLPLLPLFNLYYHMAVSKNIRMDSRELRMIGSTGDFFYDIDRWP